MTDATGVTYEQAVENFYNLDETKRFIAAMRDILPHWNYLYRAIEAREDIYFILLDCRQAGSLTTKAKGLIDEFRSFVQLHYPSLYSFEPGARPAKARRP